MRLFKYLHPDRIDVLRNGSICFSSTINLNDPFELKPHVRALVKESTVKASIQEHCKNLQDEYKSLPRNSRRKLSYDAFAKSVEGVTTKTMTEDVKADLARWGQSYIEENLLTQIGILCLTESPDNLLMWAHYADSHQGFIIEFDPDSDFFNQRIGHADELRHLRQVMYSEDRPSITMDDIQDFSPFLTKGKIWESEHEWRMMLPLQNASEVICKGSSTYHLFDYPASAIKQIIFGARMPITKQHDIFRLIAESADLSHIACISAKIDEQHYKINFAEYCPQKISNQIHI